jgi:predicted N-acetyltransferase YhbS
MDELRAMQRAVQRNWTPDSHWHIGDLAWQRPSMAAHAVALWSEPDAWATISPDGALAFHAPPERISTVLEWSDGRAHTVNAMSADARTLGAEGFDEVEAPYFRHCLRDLDDRMPGPRLPDGYRVRAIRAGETAERAAVHRAAWQPRRVGQLQVPPVDLGDGESTMTTERYAEIAATWPYRSNLDLLVEADDGTLVASALGWLDEANEVGLLEPVGVHPGHARRGLGAAVSLACLHALHAAGATLAKVCPRGDDAYPVPRALYHHIGFRDGARTATYARR